MRRINPYKNIISSANCLLDWESMVQILNKSFKTFTIITEY